MSEYDYLERDGLETLRWAEVEGLPSWPGSPGSPPSHLARMRHGATLLGIPLEVYLEHCEQGEHWCSYHRAWEPVERFATRPGRSTGALATKCRTAHAEAARERYLRRRSTRGPGDPA